VNPHTEAVYVPPRPNRGPEPLSPPNGSADGIVAGLVALALIASIAWRIARARARQRLPKRRTGSALDADDMNRDPLIAGSIAVREALATRFGAAWLAKTTEEIADDPALRELLEPDRAARLVAALQEADRAKFAETPEGPEHAAAAAYLEELVPSIGVAAARSRMSGK
jgi:hypothetical protein